MPKSVKKTDEVNKILKEKDSNSPRFAIKKETFKKVILPLIFLAVLILGLLGYFFKDRIIVAIVDNRPIFRFELNQRLTSSVFGKETLENMIVEQLIVQESRKRGINITEEDLNKEIDKISKNLGEGVKIEDALKFQGISLPEFKRQLSIRVQLNRILEKEISVSSEEIDKYMKDNAKTLIATIEAERRNEANEKIKEQKISEKVQTWVNDLLSKAKISRFLK